MRKFIFPFLFSASLLSGCVTTQKYNWGKYESSMYSYYKNPTKLDEYSGALDEIIKSSESGNKKVPPGIYAEYGYLQLQAGNNQEAIELFHLEEKSWPESKVFMEKIIKTIPGSNVVSQGGSKQ